MTSINHCWEECWISNFWSLLSIVDPWQLTLLSHSLSLLQLNLVQISDLALAIKNYRHNYIIAKNFFITQRLFAINSRYLIYLCFVVGECH